jgi:hypothetical protein
MNSFITRGPSFSARLLMGFLRKVGRFLDEEVHRVRLVFGGHFFSFM